MNKNLFVSKMKLFGDTQQMLADALGIAINTLNFKINETGGALFNAREIRIIKQRYHLTAEEVDQIFFSEKYLEGGQNEN